MPPAGPDDFKALFDTAGGRRQDLRYCRHRRDGTGWLVFSTGEPESPFFVVAAGRPSFGSDEQQVARSPTHFAFKAPSRAAVDAFHGAGLAAGAKSNGAPGVRRGRYYCAFLIDPDGNNIEAGVYADP
jgi:catechol 2,3-dioxygenase-like lactoylglutathione lyase family enzyme